MKIKTVVLLALVSVVAFPIFVAAQDEAATEEPQLPKWFSSGSLGYTNTGGNSRTNTLTGNVEVGRVGVWTNHLWKAGITYGNVIYPGGDPIRNANNYFGNYRYEQFLMKNKKPYLWIKPGAESDEFQGFWQRYTLDTGPGYSFFGTSDAVLKLEAGYLFVDTEWINKKEIEENEFHYWEPTHNALARLIASVPLKQYLLFSEEAVYYINLEDEENYRVESTSALAFKLTTRLSFQTSLKVTYTNLTPFVDDLDEKGVVRQDEAGNNLLTEANRVDTTWTNALVISFF